MYNIYKINNKVNNKIYIGLTKKSINTRLSEHKAQSKMGCERRLSQAIRKHGVDNFSTELIETVRYKEDASDREIFWIANFNSTDYEIGYNMSSGGVGKSGEVSILTRQRISNAVQRHRDSLSQEEKLELTSNANTSKRGMIESEESRIKKQIAQKERWDNTDEIYRKEHGLKTRSGISEDGKIRAVDALLKSYSPVREKGFKNKIVKCPHCDKEGGGNAMKRFHFDRCKQKTFGDLD